MRHATYAYEADPIGSDRWQLCNDATCSAIHAALRKNEHSLRLTIGRTVYALDLGSSPMTQRNTSTGVVRKLREVTELRVYLYEGGTPNDWRLCETDTIKLLRRAGERGEKVVRRKVGEFEYEYDLYELTYRNTSGDVKRRLRVVECCVYAFEDGAPNSGKFKLCDDETCYRLSEAARAGRRTVRGAIERNRSNHDPIP